VEKMTESDNAEVPTMSATTRTECPYCHHQGSIAQKLQPGTKIRCASCRKTFTYEPHPGLAGAEFGVGDPSMHGESWDDDVKKADAEAAAKAPEQDATRLEPIQPRAPKRDGAERGTAMPEEPSTPATQGTRETSSTKAPTQKPKDWTLAFLSFFLWTVFVFTGVSLVMEPIVEGQQEASEYMQETVGYRDTKDRERAYLRKQGRALNPHGQTPTCFVLSGGFLAVLRALKANREN
jgi:hypothetical protein